MALDIAQVFSVTPADYSFNWKGRGVELKWTTKGNSANYHTIPYCTIGDSSHTVLSKTLLSSELYVSNSEENKPRGQKQQAHKGY